MKAEKLAVWLDALSELYKVCGAVEAVRQVNGLSTKLSAKSKLELDTVVALRSSANNAFQTGDLLLLDLVRSLAKFQAASGAKASAKAANKFVQTLESSPSNSASVDDFAKSVEDFDLVDAFVQRLTNASGNRAEFNALIAMLTAKGVASKTQISNIARKYVGVSTKYKTVDAAIEAIRGKFSADQLFASKTKLNS